MIEAWKEIKGYEGQYEVSSFGTVKSLPRTKTCKDPYNGLRLLKIKGCILKLRVFHGYHRTSMRNITCLATAIKFGVTKGLVSKIRRRQIWKVW